ncbi:hypothetical protein Malapachy_1217 [Malassezia pachydermatis]|uniref:Uncharacterized protein n=1 Tax=Malassezia pachydermatis TaxID=77020 RepID=A0A0M8ML27_9BASI|nr:hypothetical protein Malapachy_1217 [Malassezia pachydermatis]KOS14646.1 hypothetical protein Malapachy_1217 [Malassezia pachydermatis]
MSNLLPLAAKVKASAGSSKEARRIFDGSNETCWSFDLGDPSTSSTMQLTCTLAEPRTMLEVAELRCTFAGGFAAIRVAVLFGYATQDKILDWARVQEVFPKDGNMMQKFGWNTEVAQQAVQAIGRDMDTPVTHIALSLEGSTDGFGRVTVYELGIWTQT